MVLLLCEGKEGKAGQGVMVSQASILWPYERLGCGCECENQACRHAVRANARFIRPSTLIIDQILARFGLTGDFSVIQARDTCLDSGFYANDVYDQIG